MKAKFLLTGIALSLAGSTSAQNWPVTPTLLRDIAPGNADGVSGMLCSTPVVGKLVFSGDSLTIVQKLWATDGTAVGTGNINGSLYNGIVGPYIKFISWNGKVVHGAASKSVIGNKVLYRTGVDGNPMDSLSVFSPGGELPLYDTSGALLYFLNQMDVNAVKVLQTDGTRAGTAVIPTAGIAAGRPFKVVGNELFYSVSSINSGLYKTNVTTGVHTQLSPLSQVTTVLGHAGNTVYFTVDAGTLFDLWATDGTPAGTQLLKAGLKYKPIAFKSWKGKAYFGAVLTVADQDLWTSDGTPGGTLVVFSLPAAAKVQGRRGPVVSNELVNMGDYMLFAGSDTAGTEPWRTDGTAAGTYRIKDLSPSLFGNNRGSIFENTFYQSNVIDGRLYFRAGSDTAQYQLHVTDGTAAGTVRAAYLQPKGQNAVQDDPNVTKHNGQIYFIGASAAYGYEIFSFPAPPLSPANVKATIPKVSIALYPNPARDALFIDAVFNGKTATLFNSSGVLVKTQIVNGGKVLLNEMPAGIYTLFLEGGQSARISILQ